jgi:hypothetical protein
VKRQYREERCDCGRVAKERLEELKGEERRSSFPRRLSPSKPQFTGYSTAMIINPHATLWTPHLRLKRDATLFKPLDITPQPRKLATPHSESRRSPEENQRFIKTMSLEPLKKAVQELICDRKKRKNFANGLPCANVSSQQSLSTCCSTALMKINGVSQVGHLKSKSG